MLELGGWGPLIMLWVTGGIHLAWIVRREGKATQHKTPRRAAA
ncbi:MAG: hypothetical protein ACRD3C_26100 [Vicinamibacterales bacterium]